MSSKKDVVSLSIDHDILNKLRVMAKEERRSLSNFVETVLIKLVEDKAEQ